MLIVCGKCEAKEGLRVMRAFWEWGRDACMLWRAFGRRNARMKVFRVVVMLVLVLVLVLLDEEVEGVVVVVVVGIEGMYLKDGKRRAEAVEGFVVFGLMEEVVTRMLLNGCTYKE